MCKFERFTLIYNNKLIQKCVMTFTCAYIHCDSDLRCVQENWMSQISNENIRGNNIPNVNISKYLKKKPKNKTKQCFSDSINSLSKKRHKNIWTVENFIIHVSILYHKLIFFYFDANKIVYTLHPLQCLLSSCFWYVWQC